MRNSPGKKDRPQKNIRYQSGPPKAQSSPTDPIPFMWTGKVALPLMLCFLCSQGGCQPQRTHTYTQKLPLLFTSHVRKMTLSPGSVNWLLLPVTPLIGDESFSQVNVELFSFTYFLSRNQIFLGRFPSVHFVWLKRFAHFKGTG